jgi:hypothetical protein
MAVYPELAQDSQYFKELPENVAKVDETEGGYEVSRPQHTRTPRIAFQTGHTNLSQAEKNLFAAFWNEVRGSSDSFAWIHPVTEDVYTVRFAKGFQPEYVYRGRGGNHRWDIPNIQLREV